jgi:hypothetical protein
MQIVKRHKKFKKRHCILSSTIKLKEKYSEPAFLWGLKNHNMSKKTEERRQAFGQYPNCILFPKP